MLTLLYGLMKQQRLAPASYYFAAWLANHDNQPLTLVIASWLVKRLGEGHVDLPLDYILQNPWLDLPEDDLVAELGAFSDLQAITKAWQQSPLAAMSISPILLDQQRFYLQRYWYYEQQVAQQLRQRLVWMDKPPTLHPAMDWQQVAIALALKRKGVVITGGPGTGKTYTVTGVLAQLIRETSISLRIGLAAPTGKAAVRMMQSLHQNQTAWHMTPQERACLPEQALTLHRLLGSNRQGKKFTFNKDNPLPLDVLIVDEVSMVGLVMMFHLLDALAPNCRLILLGDPDQLSAVDLGSVLADLAYVAEGGVEKQPLERLDQLKNSVKLSLVQLRQSRRFAAQSMIGQWAQLINQPQPLSAERLQQQIVASTDSEVTMGLGWSVEQVIEQAVAAYEPYRRAIQQHQSVEDCLQQFSCFRLLCGWQKGKHGAQQLNERIGQQLWGLANSQRIHHGQPIMITENDYRLELFNGDVGVILQTHEGLRSYFMTPEGLRSYTVQRLGPWQSAYAITVHKSQGSEFNQVMLWLSEASHAESVLNRRWLYTGITRARQQLQIAADSQQLLLQTINHRSEIGSGLAERLRGSW